MIKKEDKKVTKRKTWAKTWPKWPSKMTPELIQKLEQAFSYWLTDDEACLDVWISTSIFYEYQAKTEWFKERKETLKRTPNIAAKKVWSKEISGGNYQASKEWLERRDKDAFSMKTESKTEHSGTLSIWNVLNELWDSEIDLTK